MSWTIKKVGCRIIDAFELWCQRRPLRVPWTARRSNQSIPKEISIHWKDWCWSWNSNTVATWCEELTHWKRAWCWGRLREEGEGVAEDEMVWWHHRLNGHESEQSLGDIGGQRSLACCSPWGHNLATEQQQQGQMKTLTWKNTCPLRFLETLFTIAKTRTQPKWP